MKVLKNWTASSDNGNGSMAKIDGNFLVGFGGVMVMLNQESYYGLLSCFALSVL